MPESVSGLPAVQSRVGAVATRETARILKILIYIMPRTIVILGEQLNIQAFHLILHDRLMYA